MPENSLLLKAYSFNDCDATAMSVVELLKSEIDLSMWMVARVENNKQSYVISAIIDDCYGMHKGDRHKWTDSICCRMVEGDCPNYVADVKNAEQYRDLPLLKKIPISSHIGVPLFSSEGEMLGVICGIDPETISVPVEKIEQYVAGLGRLLATCYEKELQKSALNVSINKQVESNLIDPVSGMFNQTGWERHLRLEDTDGNKSGLPSGIIVIHLLDVNENSKTMNKDISELISHLSENIRSLINPFDICARLGDTELIIHTIDTQETVIRNIVTGINSALDDAGVKASVGWACSLGDQSLTSTIELAHQNMSKN